MADLVIMPKLGFDMAEGTLIRWVKAEGDSVAKGELLAEIETDKATVEVESMYGGTVRKHLVGEGAIVPVNTPIAVIGEAKEEIDFDALMAESAPQDEGTAAGEPAPVEPAAAVPAAAQTSAAPAPVPAAHTAAPQQNGNLPDGLKASPLARRMAAEKGIDLRAVAGSGPGGRIVKKDIEGFSSGAAAGRAFPALAPLGAADLGPAPADNAVPLTRLRQAIGRRMVQSKLEFPAFYVTHEFDMDRLMDARSQINAMLADSGEKISVNDFIVKATGLALREFPNLNAALQGDAVVQYGQINVGVAVAVPNGLLTVVCQDTDRKSLRQISIEIKQKAGRVRDGKVLPEDVSGSTFSVSNLGMYDVDSFIAIINPPEAGILAAGSAYKAPVVKDDALAIGWRMKATVSVDHRVSDGAEAAQFMQAVARYIENPLSLLL